MSSSVIYTDHLVKRFGHVTALSELNLDVAQGETHGFLGPNGAGKSTTIRILLGMLRGNSGRAELFGQDPWSNAPQLHRRLAYVPGDVVLWPGLTGGEIIDLLGRLRGGIDVERRDELIVRFDLDPHKKGKAYSKGNRQKVALIAAFCANVELLLLDEPTSGLDPVMSAVFNECVREARAAGKTILLSSHIMSEVEQLCHRVSIIRRGSIAESGTLDELRHLTRSLVRATTTHPVPDLSSHEGVHDFAVTGEQISCHVDAAALDEVISHISAAGIVSFVCEPPSLEDIFLQYYSESSKPAGESQ